MIFILMNEMNLPCRDVACNVSSRIRATSRLEFAQRLVWNRATSRLEFVQCLAGIRATPRWNSCNVSSGIRATPRLKFVQCLVWNSCNVSVDWGVCFGFIGDVARYVSTLWIKPPLRVHRNTHNILLPVCGDTWPESCRFAFRMPAEK